MSIEVEASQVPEPQESSGIRLYDLLMVFIISSSVVIVERLVERQFWPQFEFVSVDVQKIIQQEIEATSTFQMTPEDRAKRAQKFSAALEREVSALASTGRVVLVAPAVVSGTEDKTEEVKVAILQDMK